MKKPKFKVEDRVEILNKVLPASKGKVSGVSYSTHMLGEPLYEVKFVDYFYGTELRKVK